MQGLGGCVYSFLVDSFSRVVHYLTLLVWAETDIEQIFNLIGRDTAQFFFPPSAPFTYPFDLTDYSE